MLALLVNVTLPGLLLATSPAADLFSSAICHVVNGDPGQGEAPAKPGSMKAVCPLCLLLAGAQMAVPQVDAGLALPVPVGILLAAPRAPPLPALVARAAPQTARGPPVLS